MGLAAEFRIFRVASSGALVLNNLAVSNGARPLLTMAAPSYPLLQVPWWRQLNPIAGVAVCVNPPIFPILRKTGGEVAASALFSHRLKAHTNYV